MKGAAIAITASSSAAAFLLGNLYASNLASMGGQPIMNLAAGFTGIPRFIAQGGHPSSSPMPMCIGLAALCAVWIAYARWLITRGERRCGEEHGSARWATDGEARAFGDGDHPDNNIILTERYGLALTRPSFDMKTDRNKNVLVVGGSGSGKTRCYVKPNIMQLNASYFVTDPKGTLLGDMGGMLEDAGYRIRTFDIIDPSRSDHYNPLAYIKTESDILTFVECLIRNTTGEKSRGNDPFWENAERLLYTALTSYLIDHCPEADRNLPGLLTLLALAEAREESESFKSPLDLLFDELESGSRFVRVSSDGTEYDSESRAFADGASAFRWVPSCMPVSPEDDFSLSNYKAFKSAAGKTLKSIIISCNVRLKPLSIREIRNLLSYDEMEIDRMGDADCRTAVFASMPDTNSTFDFLFAILLWQTMDTLCNVALERYGGSLPTPVHFIMDEFANIGSLPDFERTVAVVRSRNISCSIILQSLAQLKAAYDDNAQTIVDCCDTMLFLGGKSSETNKEVSEAIGKQTLASLSVNDSRGANSSTTRNFGQSERDLLQASEVGRLPRDEAIALIAGAFPIKDKKFRIEKHERYASVDPGHPGSVRTSRYDPLNRARDRKEMVGDGI